MNYIDNIYNDLNGKIESRLLTSNYYNKLCKLYACKGMPMVWSLNRE